MPPRKHYTREQILDAMDKTKSIKAAARYLNCSYQHLKPFMKEYVHPTTGETLFSMHKNQCGKGIPKFVSHTPFGRKKEPAILDIIEGRVDSSHFSPDKIKYRMIEAGLLEEKCSDCGYQERRVTDYKTPLIMRFKDGNTKHYGMGNVHLLCYNCYFIYYGSVFTEREIERLEGLGDTTMKTESTVLQLDEYQMKILRELGLQEGDEEDPYSLVAFK
jgi:hypothetical protein